MWGLPAEAGLSFVILNPSVISSAYAARLNTLELNSVHNALQMLAIFHESRPNSYFHTPSIRMRLQFTRKRSFLAKPSILQNRQAKSW